MTKNPFADPEYEFEYGLKGKDSKPEPIKLPKAPEVGDRRDFSIEEFGDCYRITGVKYRSKACTVDLPLEQLLLDGGEHRSKTQWCAQTNKARQDGGFYVGSLPLYHSIFKTLFDNRDNAPHKRVVTIVTFRLADILKKHKVMTLSQVHYRRGADEITHDPGLDDSYGIDMNIQGPTMKFRDLPKSMCRTIMGRLDPEDISNIYNWMLGKEPYFHRHAHVKDEKISPILLKTDNDKLLISTKHDETTRAPAIGVRIKGVEDSYKKSGFEDEDLPF